MKKWIERWKDMGKKIRLDKRVAVVLTCVAAAACILLVLQLYAMKQVTVLELDAAALPGEEILDSLREHSLERDEAVRLEHLKENEVLYRRGNDWFAGEARRAFAGTAPLYVNDGNYLWLLGVKDARMYDEDWQAGDAPSGMYISAGKAFNFDGSSTGDPDILFLQLANGVFVNTVSFQIDGAGSSLSIPSNSYLDLKEDGIYYLSRQAGEKLIYSEIPAAFGMQATVNGETLTYEELLIRLGVLQKDQEEVLPGEEQKEEPEEALPQENVPQETGDGAGQDRDDREETDRLEEEDKKDADGSGTIQGNPGQETGQPQENPDGIAGDAGQDGIDQNGDGKDETEGEEAGDDGSEDTRPGGSGDSDGNKGDDGTETEPGAGTEEGGATGGGGEGGVQPGDPGSEDTQPGGGGGSGDDTPEEEPGDGEDDGTGGEPGEPGTGGGSSEPAEGDTDGSGGSDSETVPGEEDPPVWTKPVPEIICGNDDISIYSMEASLHVRDTYGCFDRVVLMLSWDLDDPNDTPDADTQLQLRRTLREKGDFSIDSLPPGEKIFVASYLQYYAEDGTKIQETEPFQTFVIETKPFEAVDPVFVSFSDALKDSDSGWYYENQIETYGLKLCSTNSNVLSKVYRARLEVYEKDNTSDPLAAFNITSGTLNKYKTLQGLDYQTLLSQFVLPADTQYRYRLEFFDRYGNSFNEEGKVLWGEAEAQNPADWIRAEGYGAEGESYEPKTSQRWQDSHDKVGAESFYWGYTHTSKTVPSASMETVGSFDKLTTLSDIGVKVEITDPHNALTPDAGGSLGTVLGQIPQTGGKAYKVCLSLSNTHTGESMYFTCQDENGNKILTAGETDAQGAYHKYDASTAGAGLYAYIPEGSLPGGNGSGQVEFRGLTAGETYEIRIYATFDLNDSHPELTEDVEIGSMRFSTTAMSSYGRIYYRFKTEHVKTAQPEGVLSYDHEKYESSTAQKAVMEINTTRTTQPVLVSDFFNRLEVELKHRSGRKDTLARFCFERDQGMDRAIEVKVSQLDAEGWYCADLEAGTDYTVELPGSLPENRLPDVRLRIPVSEMFTVQNDGDGSEEYYSFTLWEALSGISRQQAGASFAAQMPKLEYDFDEGDLESYTGYTLSAAAIASQGGREHTVTASGSTYRQVNFTTLKDMPYVTMEDMLQVGSSLYLVGLEFHDYNRSVNSGAVTIINKDRQTGKEQVLSCTLYYSQEGGYIANVDIGGLRDGRNYELQVLANDIRRTGGAAAYRYQNEVLYTYAYTAGEGVSGRIRLNSLTYPLKNLSSDEEQHVMDEYSKYEPGNFEYGQPSVTDGTVTYSDSGTTYQTATPIEVKPGEIYYLHNLMSSSKSVSRLILLDKDQKPMGRLRNIYSDSYIRIPEGAAYMQFLMQGTMSAGDGRTVPCAALAQAIKIYDAKDAQLTELGLIKEETEGTGTLEVGASIGDKVAVVSAEWIDAAMSDGARKAEYRELSADGKTLRSGTLTCYPGASLEVQKQETVKVELSFNGSLMDYTGAAASWQVRVIDLQKLEGFSDMLFDSLVANYTASVQDRTGSLYAPAGGDNIRVRVYSKAPSGEETEYTSQCYTAKTGGYREDTSSGVTEYVDGSWENTRTFQSETGYTYRITLSIVWRGTEYELDSLEVEAEGNVYTISTGKQLLKMVTWPSASFRVLEDLEADSTIRSLLNVYSGGSLAYGSFYGTLDGDGHSLDYTVSSNGGYLFRELGSGGLIENLEINYTLDGRANRTMLYYTGIIENNYGTIRNVVLRYNLGQGNYRHSDGGGLCRSNRGTIERFAVYFVTGTGDSNVLGGGMGGVCNYNRGIIRDGIVYSSSILRVSTGMYGGTTDFSISSTGGVCGSNMSGGLIENVYAMLSMGVEQNSGAKQIGSLSGWGLIAGSNGGMIRNCFTNGEMYYQAWERDAAGAASLVSAPVNTYRSWPGTAVQGKSYEDNCYYYSNSSYLKNDVYTQFVGSPAALHSAAFYHGSINKGSGFVVEEQLEAGYYPIVDMPECMEGVQTSISLRSSGMGAYPSYLSSSLVKKNVYLSDASEEAVYYEGDIISAEEAAALKGSELTAGLGEEAWETYLETQADGSFRVRQQFALVQFIFSNSEGYDLSGLVVNGLTTVQLAADREEFSTVTALLTPGTWENTNPISYGDSYQLTSYTYGLAGMNRVVTLDSRFVNVRFYYPLSGQSWNGAPVSTTQTVNYRLVEDIHFKDMEGSAVALNKFADTNLRGEFDGGGYCLDYEGIGEKAYIFGGTASGAKLQDLYVRNLTLGGSNAGYLGFVRQTAANVILKGIHLENIEIRNAYQYAGSLVAYAQNATIEDCTAVNVKITSSPSARNLYAGGMVGSGVDLSIHNCFVRELDMNTSEGISVSGTGGLTGYMYNAGGYYVSPSIRNCYVQGDITTHFSYCGGIAGRGSGSIGNCWTAVNIYGNNNVGSILGYALASGPNNYNYHNSVVVSGELYTSSGTVERRLVGLWESTAASIPRSYAYSGQLINSAASEDPMDVGALSSADTMKEYYFWTDQAAFGEDWYLYGISQEEYGEEIPDVKAAYVYPILYTADGSGLLPDQAPVYYELPAPDFVLKDAEAELKDAAADRGTYDLEITVQMGGGTASADYFDQYLKDQVSAEGLELVKADPVIDCLTSAEAYKTYSGTADVVLYPSKMTTNDGEEIECVEVVYRKVNAVNRWDSYLLRYEDAAGAKVMQKVIFHAPGAEPAEDGSIEAVPLYWHLSEATDWTDLLVTGGHGNTFENFKLERDLVFSSTDNVGDSLKLNRLEGSVRKDLENYELRTEAWADTPEFTVIRNASINKGGQPWISEVSGRVGEVHFAGISLKETYNASYFGIIGRMTGTLEYTDFSDISITTGSSSGSETYSYLGCIGYASGAIENVRLHDIKIQGMNASAYFYSYVGGLTGYARQISKVYAFGSELSGGSYGYSITMGGTSTVTGGNYYGGLAGYVAGSGRELYGKNLQVTGKSGTGGLVGYLRSSDYGGLLAEPIYDAVNVKVTGFSQVGGIVGSATWASISNARVTGAEVEARTATGMAGGVFGDAIPRYCQAYNVKVSAPNGDYAGGIVGRSSGGALYCKAANVEVSAVNNAGGIMGGGYASVRGCAVTASAEENSSTVTAVKNNAGGIVGRLYQNVHGYGQGDVYSNAVSRTEIQAANYAGGTAGRLTCSNVYYNDTDDSVTVKVSQNAGGGIAGELEGCVTYNNISGASVGAANNIGGIAGQVIGYGNSTSAGGTVKFHVSKMYGNMVVNKNISGIHYVAGLVGLFSSGDRVIDPETGEDISEASGWTQYMSNRNFHSNTIAPKTLRTENANGAYFSWYANYSGTNSTFSANTESRYDCILSAVVNMPNAGYLKLPKLSAGAVGSKSGLTKIESDALKNGTYYTTALGSGSTEAADKATGGPGFPSGYLDTSGLAKGYYPYLRMTTTLRIPYQTSGEINLIAGTDWNTTGAFDSSGYKETAYNGDGIAIEETGGSSLFSLEEADNLAYASGIDKLNLDFTHIDSDMIGFRIVDAYGRTLMEDTTLESAAGSGKVCTISYDFQTDFAVVLYSADYTEQKTYPYRADQLRSTVMTWADGYYYLKSDGVYRVTGDGETELAEEGAFVHLYEGQALGEDGTAVDLP
ncbi:MAG: hypothetical protein KH452_02480 [Clostridiales bacterium]|nr:hypothetical protein [Clostridiales bacterium]